MEQFFKVVCYALATAAVIMDLIAIIAFRLDWLIIVGLFVKLFFIFLLYKLVIAIFRW